MEFRDSEVAEVDAEDAAGTTTRSRFEGSRTLEASRARRFDRPSAADNPPPFKPALAGVSRRRGTRTATSRRGSRSSGRSPPRSTAGARWASGTSPSRTRAGARRALARCRAEQYARFAELLEGLAADETRRDETGDETGDETRALRLADAAPKLATTETRTTPRAGPARHVRAQSRHRGEAASPAAATRAWKRFRKRRKRRKRRFLRGRERHGGPTDVGGDARGDARAPGMLGPRAASCAAAGAAGAADALTRARARGRAAAAAAGQPLGLPAARRAVAPDRESLTTTQKETRTVSPHRIVTRRL